MVIKGESNQQQAPAQSNAPISPAEEVGVRRDLKAVNTTVMLLSQKMGYLVRNEKVLSKNILILNEKIKRLDDSLSAVKTQSFGGGVSSDELDPIKAQIDELYNKVKGLKTELETMRAELDSLRSGFATKAEVKELKYLVDAINPLEFVTYKQLREMIKK